jgi:hypothetical protein
MVASPSAGAPSQLPHPLIVMQPSLTPQVLPDPLYEEKVSEGDDDNDDSGVSSCESGEGDCSEANPTVHDNRAGAKATTKGHVSQRKSLQQTPLPEGPPLPRLAPESEPGMGQGGPFAIVFSFRIGGLC